MDRQPIPLRAHRGTLRPVAPAPLAPVLDVTVILLEAGYASTAIGPIEVFHSAGQLWERLHGQAPQPRFRVRVASLDGRPVGTLCAVGLIPEYSIDQIEHTDLIIVPASGLEERDQITRNTRLVQWLQAWHARGAHIAGICTGAGFLAEAGLLDGRRATTHWAMAEEMRGRYPHVRWDPDQFVTEDGRVYCSGGVYAALDLSLYLVEKFCGHEIALQCAKSLLLSLPRTRQTGYAVLPLSRAHDDSRIRQAEEYLQKNFGRDVSIEGLAGRVAMSPRNFIRRFKAATGRLPSAYVQALRMAEAKALFEQGHATVQEVAAKTGYDNVAFFRSLFKRHTGMTPAEYRRRFARMTYVRADLANGKTAA